MLLRIQGLGQIILGFLDLLIIFTDLLLKLLNILFQICEIYFFPLPCLFSGQHAANFFGQTSGGLIFLI
jgi:hypothetical protein